MTFLRQLSAWTIIGLILAMTLPVATASILAARQGEQREARYLLALARSALRPSDGTGDQLAAGVRVINAMSRAQACSPAGLDQMRNIDLSSTMLQGVGWIEGDIMRCSSFSGATAVDLGPADIHSATGADLRTNLRLGGTDLTYLAVSSGAFVGIVHKDLPLSFVDTVPHLTVGVFNWSTGRALVTRGGGLNPAWHDPKGPNQRVFRADGRIVAVVRSKRYDTGAVATLPLTHLAGFVREAAMVLVPLAVVVSLLLSAAVLSIAKTRASMPALIRQGLRAQEFYLEYQPVIDAKTGATVGAEALLRWRRAGKDLVSPDIFIPVAEQSGLIDQVTARVLDLLAADVPPVLRLAPAFHFGVNFAASDMHRSDILGQVGQFLATSGLPPENLVIEATERSLVDITLATRTMQAFRRQGVRIAIDDFGTGYSSLGYLAQLEVDYLKIDKLFVQALGTNSATSHVAARIIDMSRDLNLQLIAEGVETTEQRDLLRAMKVDLMQGYLHGRPMGIECLLQRLRSERQAKATRAAAGPERQSKSRRAAALRKPVAA